MQRLPLWLHLPTLDQITERSALPRYEVHLVSSGARHGLGLLLLFWIAGAIVVPAQTFRPLVSFDETNGANPNHMVLVQGLDGNLYGTTNGGGANGYGTVFKITPKGGLTMLYSFCSLTNCLDGSGPYAGLVQATDGNLYGSTTGGGSSSYCGGGCGTVFRASPQGAVTTLYNFCSQPNCADGTFPVAAMVQAADGNLYGTTSSTVFRITLTGKLATLFTFSRGILPVGLIQAADGNFYGVTDLEGAGGGSVFKITPTGVLTTLYTFCAQTRCTDGSGPYAGVIQAFDGNFYGTTIFGGSNGAGTVFKITPQGALTTLYSFCSQPGCLDGSLPFGGLVQGTDGSLYGTTQEGGSSASQYDGTAFRITTNGALTTLYNFCSRKGCADGDTPNAGVTQNTNGAFYGTANEGGTSGACLGGCGTVFGLAVGLGPFVRTLPTGGKVGTKVIIEGTSLTGATAVSFDGTAAEFTVVSPTEITTSVPDGATTGKVKVATSAGTLTSNAAFQVK
jgi:uncharacterized repeat protein (TIGR03803 family)